MNPCEGYACPPTHSVPAGDAIVEQVTNLAATGANLASVLGWVAIGLALVAFGLAMLSLRWSAKARRIRRRLERGETGR